MGETATQTADADRDERRVLDAALAGDRLELVKLARLLTPEIRVRVARAMTRRGARQGTMKVDVDDFSQEVFVRLFANDARALRAWDPTRGLSLVRFVGMIAEREVSNVFRSGRRVPRNDRFVSVDGIEERTVSLDLGSEERLVYRDLLVKLTRRLDAWLTPRGRKLFDEVYVKERPLPEVAERFEMQPGALYAWRTRVARQARVLLDELTGGDGPEPGGREK